MLDSKDRSALAKMVAGAIVVCVATLVVACLLGLAVRLFMLMAFWGA